MAEDAERRAKTCCSVADALDAQSVADRLDIPFYALDFERDFARIKDYFADEYLAGRTPNPCVMCNIWLKFGKLWSYGKQVGADFVATGHYARIVRSRRRDSASRPGGRPRQGPVVRPLRTAARAAAARPVPGRRLHQVRDPRDRPRARPARARQARQPGDLLRARRRLPGFRARPPARARDGRRDRRRGRDVLGEHAGIEAFTIGQRRGLGIAVGAPRYVVQIEPLTRTVTVGRKESLEKPGLTAVALQLAGPIAGGADPLPGPDPRPASRRARDRRAASTASALG